MPALAGLTTDNSVYVAGEDGLWHHIPDVATFAALGYDWNAITWYGDLPGTVGEPLAPATAGPALVAATPFATQPTPAGASASPAYAGPLAGLESDRSVYLAAADQWHHIPDVETFNAMRLDWNAITWYGALPGTVGEPVPSSAASAPVQETATPFASQPTPANGPQADGGGALAGLPDGRVFLAAEDGLWHHIPDIGTFNAMGLDWEAITWYGQTADQASLVPYDGLPGNIGHPLPSLAATPPSPTTATAGRFALPVLPPIPPIGIGVSEVVKDYAWKPDYNFSFSLGTLGSPSLYMDALKRNFSAIFPIPNAGDTLRLNDYMQLKPALPSIVDPFVADTFPVQVTTLTATSFTFTAQKGHPDGEGSTVTFTFSEANGEKLLTVTAHRTRLEVSIFGGDIAADYFAWANWNRFAESLRHMATGLWTHRLL